VGHSGGHDDRLKECQPRGCRNPLFLKDFAPCVSRRKAGGVLTAGSQALWWIPAHLRGLFQAGKVCGGGKLWGKSGKHWTTGYLARGRRTHRRKVFRNNYGGRYTTRAGGQTGLALFIAKTATSPSGFRLSGRGTLIYFSWGEKQFRRTRQVVAIGAAWEPRWGITRIPGTHCTFGKPGDANPGNLPNNFQSAGRDWWRGGPG